MSKRVVTYDEAVAAVKALPLDGMNPGCLYTVRDQHCAVGQVFVDLGVPCPGESSPLNTEALGHEGRVVWDWLEEQGVTFEERAENLLAGLQYSLDTSIGLMTWGEARDRCGL